MVEAAYAYADRCPLGSAALAAATRLDNDIASIAWAKPVASATMPKSAGRSSRASTRVLISPRARVAMRQPTIQPAPVNILP